MSNPGNPLQMMQPNPNMSHPAQRPVEPVHENTKEQILEAIKNFTKLEGYKAEFDTDQNTWHFSYKGKNEAGNMSIPLRVIVMKAESVSKGARVPPMDKDSNGKFLWGAR